jgi:tetratricopeptide (TPR) repeat protein
MPLARYSAEEANRNLRRNRASIWPDGRLPTNRLGKLAQLTFTPSFTFSQADRIMTIGSCFAREMETRLAQLGFDLPMKAVALPAEERATKTENDIISKFTVQSIENELLWASGRAAPPPGQLFLQVGEGLWHDPQLVNNVHPASIERVAERREMVQAAFRQLPGCRIVIITLGLAEAWFDHETSLYLNTAPPTAASKRHPNRFSLDVLDYDDIYSSLERIYALLQKHGHPDFRVLITVSPVPFKATFTGEDAITANTYSKSVQRAACQAFVARHGNVDYFPSYEIVTMSDRELVYERDNVHIGGSTVAYIVDQVLANYTPDLKFRPAKVVVPKTRRAEAQDNHLDLFVRAKHHADEAEFDKAAEICREALDRFYDRMSDRDKSIAHNLYGTVLMRMKSWSEAAEQFVLATGLAPAEAEHWQKLGNAYRQLGRRKEAVEVMERAAEINPGDVHVRNALTRVRVESLALKDASSSGGFLAGLRRLLGGKP